ncbi:MAG: T9SS type A sorting domain-containing protein [Bacteroidota bacterium]|nr:T9SS type A sorting domain-containing protein [Bacteroidota bacterium]
MKKIYLVFQTILLSMAIQAQSFNFEWAKSIGAEWDDVGYAIATDSSHNVYIGGRFRYTVDFDPGPGVFNLTSCGNNIYDIYILKLDSSGNFIWAKSIGGFGNDACRTITIDSTGYLLVLGYFQNEVDFDPGTANYNLTSAGDYSTFILKLNPLGDFVWVKAFGGSGNIGSKSIAVDGPGNIYMAGSFYDTVDVDPDTTVYNIVSTFGNLNDIFILKLDSQGDFAWAVSFGCNYHDEGNSITVDASGDVYVTGTFDDSVDFDPGVGTYYLHSNGYGRDAFFLKLSSNGDLIWAKSVGGVFNEEGQVIKTAPDGNLVITGTFTDTVDFDPGPADFYLYAPESYGIFIEKLDPDGNFIWASSMQGSGINNINDLAIDNSGHIYLTGSFGGALSFNSSTPSYDLISNGNADIFIEVLDADGNFYWATSFGEWYSEYGFSITCDDEDFVYATGGYRGTIDFNPGPDTFNLTSNGSIDVYVLKLHKSMLGINIVGKADGISVFPNPFHNIINIDFGEIRDVTITVFDISGQIVFYKDNINTSTYQFEINKAQGIYIMEVSSQGEKRKFKLVKN